MTDLTIYDSQGKPYDPSGGGQQSELIKDLFFSGVKVYAEFGSEIKIAAFFRASDSNASRSEQYYAVYQTRQQQNVFRQFKSDLRQLVEQEYGMVLQTSGNDVEVFRKLEQSQTRVPGSDFEHDLVENLLSSGQRLSFGVRDTESALSLFQKYSNNPAQRIAIADNADTSDLPDTNLVIEVGNHSGLTPIGDTKAKMDNARSQMERQFTQTMLASIKQDVSDLRMQTDKSDAEIRNRLKRELSIFESPAMNAGSSSSSGGLLSGLSKPTRAAVTGVGAAAAVVVILLLLVNVLIAVGLGGAVPTALGPLGIIGDDGETGFDELVIQGEDEHYPLENESVIVVPNDGAIWINGETDQDDVQVDFDSDADDEWSEHISVDDGEFDSEPLDIQNSGNLTIQAGNNSGGSFDSEYDAIEVAVDSPAEDAPDDGDSGAEETGDEEADSGDEEADSGDEEADNGDEEADSGDEEADSGDEEADQADEATDDESSGEEQAADEDSDPDEETTDDEGADEA
ncbi:hypothetical protein D8Y22_06990 [Salinadaptatus halalkaliphilus]|uniref:Uncharacterized protein n=1 Tax=Salinadaptatus halalkaliphilus TaxID=2419781 RepID=A0A4S3TMQ4_9EURY|nr:hypothetical protein [Salinadaptatus halalkaliphilus]THE65554.1 hypothetical protein D8Y22_06990 [Salinadaptatus halalkaliphilus]